MNFKKSLVGFKPNEVDLFIEELSNKHKEQRNELLNEAQELNTRYNQLVEKNNSLKADLIKIEDDSLFLHDRDRYITKIIRRAKKDAVEEINSIKVNHEIYFNNIIEATSKLDELASLLREDLATLNISLQNLVNSMSLRTEIDDYLQKVNEIIDSNEDKDYVHKDYLKYISDIENVVKKDLKVQRKPKLSLLKTDDKEDINFLKDLEIGRKPFDSVQSKSRNFEQPRKREKAEIEESIVQRPHTALIGERNKDTLDLLTVIVEREGYEVTTTQSAEDIIEQVDREDPYGVLILDSMIPYVEVNSLIRQIRRSNSWCDTPILVLTQETTPEISAEYLLSGANDYIVKPFNPKELIARINKLNKLSPQECLMGSI